MNIKFKGNLHDFKQALKELELKDGLITDQKGNTKFGFVEGEGIVGVDKTFMYGAVDEHEKDYKKVLAEVNFKTGNVELRDAGNYMEVPISVIQEVCKFVETH